MTITEAAVLDALRNVIDPDLHQDIVSLDFVKRVEIKGGTVSVVVELTTPACPMKERLRNDCTEQIRSIPGVTDVKVEMTAAVRKGGAQGKVLPGVKNIVAVASGKGGVGKSTVAVNLAAALAHRGAQVGLLDADVYGPSLGRYVDGATKPSATAEGLLEPFDAHGLKLMSLGLLLDENAPVMWRGPMASSLIQQFLTQVGWGELDYLVVDLPPGTGDVQLTLTQMANLSGAVIVTTPQDVASEVAEKGLKMFGTVNVPVLGVIENMSYFVCGKCNEKHDIFRPRGGARPSDSWNVPTLGRIPIEPALASLSDDGIPAVTADPNSTTSRAFLELADQVAAALSKLALGGNRSGIPTQVSTDGPRLEIKWNDGHTSEHDYRELRFLCSCARCVDEHTGERIITRDQIKENIRPERIEQTGRYALQIHWSDGHKEGLYTFDRLRKLCECKECRTVAQEQAAQG
ncbi:MAG: P-loop NTPase [Planctomycetota bacterium]